MNSDTGLLDQQRTVILVYWTSNEQGYWFIGPATNRDTGLLDQHGLLDQQRTWILVYRTSNEQGYWFVGLAMNRDTGLLDQQ